ncbi:hypothetical protein E4K66_26235 [Bradyrhizobium frederickii]|uniref:Uncharacterized protein n=1 Tax=Bradyrhizobium frederickii TaxID=2560054 RepID=A0A4Y9KZ57_9BRAD|nr:hypothetical protein [Bradyrhizobium frederickii]TFV35799.1 hypothetical protein E4K66_26235 [Bradyrhizobium frederickii]
MTPDEEQSGFYENLGRCIAQWSHVEDGLYEVYATAIAKADEVRRSNVPAQAAYFAIQAPEGKIAMTDSAVRFRLLFDMGESHDDPQRRLFAAWDALKKTVDDRRKRRNQLAHFQVLVSMSEPEGRRFALRPALFNPNAQFRTLTLFHREELKVAAASFGRASWDLRTFAYGLAKHFKQNEDAVFDDELKELMARTADKVVTEEGFIANN